MSHPAMVSFSMFGTKPRDIVHTMEKDIMKKLIITVALLILSGASNSLAQNLRIGDKVRVTLSSTIAGKSYQRLYTGQLLDVDADTLLITTRGRQQGILLSSISQMEISMGRGRGYPVLGALIGAGIGVWVGHVITKNKEYHVNDSWPGISLLPGENLSKVLIYLVSTVIAGVGGACIGSAIKTDRWEPILIPGSLNLYPQSGSRFGVGFSYTINLSGDSTR